MLISCNPRCKKSDGRTDGSLDIDRNEVVCKICGEDVLGISSFTKQSMKQNKDVITPAKKAFMFDCKNCHKKGETVVVNGVPYGKDCSTKNCTIIISDIMASAMEKISPTLKKLEEYDEGSSGANKAN